MSLRFREINIYLQPWWMFQCYVKNNSSMFGIYCILGHIGTMILPQRQKNNIFQANKPVARRRVPKSFWTARNFIACSSHITLYNIRLSPNPFGQNCQNPSSKQWRFIANDPSFPFKICLKWVSGCFTLPMPILPHLLRQAGTIRRTAQGCMERHCQGCSTIFHPIGVQAIADDHDIRLFLREEMRRQRWMFWKK